MALTNNIHRPGRCSNNASRPSSSKIGKVPSIVSHNFRGFSQFVPVNTGIIFRLVYDHFYGPAVNRTWANRLAKIQGSKTNCRTASFHVRGIYRRLEKHKREKAGKGDVTDWGSCVGLRCMRAQSGTSGWSIYAQNDVIAETRNFICAQFARRSPILKSTSTIDTAQKAEQISVSRSAAGGLL